MKSTVPALRKEDFPLFSKPENQGLVYLDSAATTQKPRTVIEAMNQFYTHEYGTVRRGVYKLSSKATQAYEETRAKTAKLLGASRPEEIIYTSGSTQSINLVAYTYGMEFIERDDEIILSQIEHHANIVPWQMVCEKKGAKLKIIPVLDNGELDLLAYKNLISPRTRFVSITHVSNALGTVNPIKEMIALAHAEGAIVLVDGAQSTPHLKVDVQDLDADFYVFSGHKIYGPTGIGILYGKYDLLDLMPPYQRGGDMIELVTMHKTTFQKPPYRFEAGTPNISGVIGLGVAIDYLNSIGLEKIERHEQDLLKYGTELLSQVPGLNLYGRAQHKGGIISFTLDKVHPHDIGSLLDDRKIAIRAGHHCAQPTMQRFGVSATARASFGVYNGSEDLDLLKEALLEIQKLFS